MLINATLLSPAIKLDHLSPVMAFSAGMDGVIEWLKNICDTSTPIDPLIYRS
jgi:hypothetical protein